MTEEEINIIAERAAEKAINQITGRIYQEVGRTILEKLVWIIGLVTVGAYLWLQSKGIFNKHL